MFMSAEDIMTMGFVTSASGHCAFIILEQTLHRACQSHKQAMFN
jgi:hypothetical protein